MAKDNTVVLIDKMDYKTKIKFIRSDFTNFEELEMMKIENLMF